MRTILSLTLIIGVLLTNHKTFAEGRPTAKSLEGVLMTPSQKSGLEKAKAQIKAGQLDAAVKQLRSINDPPQSDVMRLLAQVLVTKKDYLEAIRALEIAVAANPRDFKAFTDLGLVYLQSGRIEKANENIRKSLEINSQYRPSYEALLQLFEKKKSNYEMRVVLTDMIAKFGEKAEFFHRLCRLYALDNFSENAVTSCQKAIEVDPSFPDSHVYMGLTYKRSENPKQGETIIYKTADHFANSEFAQFTAGATADETKNYERATKYYLRGLKADPKSERCTVGLARAYFSTKNYGESLRYYGIICKTDRTILTELQKMTSLVRMAGQNGWYEKFELLAEHCGI